MSKPTEHAQTTARQDAGDLAGRWVFHICFVIYVFTLAWVTLKPRLATGRIPLDWVPLDNIIQVLREGESVSYDDAGQLLGNIALFVPLGWLMPMLWRKLRSLWKIVALAGATSVAIEISQLLFISGRQSSTDDVVLNITGAFIGAVMFFAPRRVPS